jgi:Ketopantoate reductase
MILGLGVIGTVYAYAFQKAGFVTEHFIREEKRDRCPESLEVNLLDGRQNRKGKDVDDIYIINKACPDTDYDFIFVSVSGNRLKEAVDTLNKYCLRGTILIMNGIKDSHGDLDALMGGRKYLLGYPVAGGQLDLENAGLNCVLFDHIMLEGEEKANIGNYNDIASAFHIAGIKTESPYDMLEWIWLHMAINTGVITTAASIGNIADTSAAARKVMNSADALRNAVLTIREGIGIIVAMGVNPALYQSEIAPYKLPALPAGIMMKYMFRRNRLTRRIMELHANADDLIYVCGSIYEKGKELNVKTPLLDRNYKILLEEIGNQRQNG